MLVRIGLRLTAGPGLTDSAKRANREKGQTASLIPSGFPCPIPIPLPSPPTVSFISLKGTSFVYSTCNALLMSLPVFEKTRPAPPLFRRLSLSSSGDSGRCPLHNLFIFLFQHEFAPSQAVHVRAEAPPANGAQPTAEGGFSKAASSCQ